MKEVSNSDLALAARLLKAFSLSGGKSVRELNDRRRAALLAKKFDNTLCKSETKSTGKG